MITYHKLLETIGENLFDKHPYHDSNIGKMEHLDAATLDEFNAFFDKYYSPNNAVLIVAGDINKSETKRMIEDYFELKEPRAKFTRNFPQEAPITETKKVNAYDSNIQIPAIIAAYRLPGQATRDSYVLDMISSYLSGGKSSVLYKKIVDDQKQALQVAAVNLGQD